MRNVVQFVAWSMLSMWLAGDTAARAQFRAVAVGAFDARVDNSQKVVSAQPTAMPAERTAPILYLNDGDYFAGTLQNSPTKNVLRWQAQGAVEPFEFAANTVRSAYFPPPEKRPAPNGEYCIELSDGDTLFGSLAALTKDQLEVDSAQFGHLKIARSEVHRLTPAVSAAQIYRGPNGLAEWTIDGDPLAHDQWRDEAGRLITGQRHAAIKKGIAIPEQAHIEFEVSWSKAPSFVLAFSASDKPARIKDGYRLEVWSKKLVLVRELSKTADVAVVTEIDDHTDRIHLEAFYNHPTGEFSIRSLDGRELAKIKLRTDSGHPLRTVWFSSAGAGVCLEQLSVSHWNGHLPKQVDADKPRIHKKDGSVIYAEVEEYQPATKQFIAHSGAEQNAINAADIECIVLKPSERYVPMTFRIDLNDGSRFSGDLAKVEGEKIFLQHRGIDQPLACAIANVRSLVGLGHETPARSLGDHRFGRWDSAGIFSHGALVAAKPSANTQATCLAWQPRYSNTASALRTDVSGRIVYRETPQQPKQSQTDENGAVQVQQVARPQPGFFGAIARVFDGQPVVHDTPRMNGAGSLCLLTGDRIPCEAIQIDEEGIHLTSSTVAADFVPHRAVKALEFVPKFTSIAIVEAKRIRLLTVPRMQKGNPPTHLVVSTAGDFLRCRLISMSADSLVVETRLESKKLPRNRVACIIWLHELDGDKPATPPKNPPPPAPTGLQIQAVQSDGIRLTFVPRECDGTSLAGVSDVLGACRVRLMSVDQIILGSMIGKAAAEQIYGTWKLHDAVQPQFATEPAGGSTPGSAPKVESILIGRPAPDFQLDLLDGGKFKLSEQKGKVVVLDFWASWCGPCMQALPEVDKVTSEFKDRGVRYIAVNMQEDKAAATSALERLKIHPTVALDIDGAAAERFQVSAIPQIVVVDTETNVAELFIGANPGLSEQLKASIQKALEPKAAPAKH